MPDWLPDIFCVDPWTQSTYDMLYGIFCRDIRDHDLRYFGNNVWIYRETEDGISRLVLSKKSRFLAVKRNFTRQAGCTLMKVDIRICAGVSGFPG